MQKESTGARRLSPAKIGKFVAAAFSFHNRHNAKCTYRRQRVRHGVVKQRDETLLGVRHQRKQHVTNVRNGRIGKQSCARLSA